MDLPFYSEVNSLSVEWTATDIPGRNRPKKQQSAGLDRASVFWHAVGILYVDYLEKHQTTTSDLYMAQLVRLMQQIAKKSLYDKEKMSCFTKTMHGVTSRFLP